MASSFGTFLRINIFGESHAKAIGMTIDGLPSGINVNYEKIEVAMSLRHGINSISAARKEEDKVEFICGVLNGKTTGSPLTFIIYNKDIQSASYYKGMVRPSHADLPAYVKYDGFNDFNGGGYFSGRLTACFIVLGVLCDEILEKRNIKVGSRISSIHTVFDGEIDEKHILKSIENFKDSLFPVANPSIKEEMIKKIEEAKNNNDSVGGTVQSFISGLPIGLGEPYFDSLESSISHLMFSLGGVKGIEFGDGFALAKMYGSEANDQLEYDGDKIKYLSNHNGGINGGLSNGNVLTLKTAIKPTSSIGKPQKTINLETKENEIIEIKGRHDPCIVPRIVPVINSILSYVIVDMLMAMESKNI